MAFGKAKKTDLPAEANDVKLRASKTGIMTIPGVKIDEVRTLIIGTSLLCTHKFDEKMRRAMEDKQQGIARGAREAKNPENVFQGARYRLHDGTDGVRSW